MSTAYYITFFAVLVILCTSLSADPQVKTVSFGLCCDLIASQLEEEGDHRCVTQGHGSAAHHQPEPLLFNISITMSVPIPHNNTLSHGVICFDIMCWVEGSPGQFICNLKSSAEPLGTHRTVSRALECLRGQSVEAVQCRCDGSEMIRCSLPWSTAGQTVSMTMTISSGHLTARSPVMCFLSLNPRGWCRCSPAQSVESLKPPVNLQYNVTVDGEVVLSWTDPQPVSHPLTYSIRYTSTVPIGPWVHVGEITSRSLSLMNLSAGVTYTVQVRCRTPGVCALWSPWSRPFNICLPEVTYLPETVMASAGFNVTVYCVFHNRSLSARKVAWWRNMREKVPENQHSAVNDYVSSVGLLDVRPETQQRFSTLQCCQQDGGGMSICSINYATLYVTDTSVAVSCQTNGDVTAMTCTWNSSQWAKFQYQTRDLPCVLIEVEGGFSQPKDCPVGGLSFSRCTIQPLLPVACYKVWLEFGKESNPVKSAPILVTPMDWVKPYPPYDLDATTIPEGHMSITWKRHTLPVYDHQFEVHYILDKPGAQGKILFPTRNQSIVVPVLDPCSTYMVQVRCKRYNGPGLWSDWSRSYRTRVHNSKAPGQGPDFWREIQEDPTRNQTNITLLFMHLGKEEPLCCVEGLSVELHNQMEPVLSQRLGLVDSYTFPWRADVHSVTVMALAWNNMGFSTRNINMTLIRRFKHPKSVARFSAARVNSSCIRLTWILLPASPAPLSFVIEWQAQSTGAGMKWIRVPAHSRIFYLHDSFTFDDYSFVLYPIFMDGEGDPAYTKEGVGRSRAQQTACVLLLIIVLLTVVLILAVSQRWMVKLIWWDVPDPINCSWAQGVDFKKADILEDIFTKNQSLVPCTLLVELETISKAVVVDGTGSLMQDTDRALSGAEVGKKFPVSPENLNCQEMVASEVLVSSTSLLSVSQSTGSYSPVLIPEKVSPLCKRAGQQSGSSDEGNFSVSSRMSGSSFGGYVNSPEEFSVTVPDEEDEVLNFLANRRAWSCLGVTAEVREQGVTFLRWTGRHRCNAHSLGSSAVFNNRSSSYSTGDLQVNTIPKYMPHVQSDSSE